MTNFSTDADLLKLEPGLFEEVAPAVQTFDPRHEEARWALLARFGLEMDSDMPEELERCRGTLRRASVALVLATVYRGQAEGLPNGSPLACKAQHYARVYEDEVAKVRLCLEETDPIRRLAMNDVPVLKIESEEALKDLLADLKGLGKRSAKTRAAYSRVLEDADGNPLVRIEVHFPIERG